jgi:hypothetical protein
MEVMVSIRHGLPPFSPSLASLKILSNIFPSSLPIETNKQIYHKKYFNSGGIILILLIWEHVFIQCEWGRHKGRGGMSGQV